MQEFSAGAKMAYNDCADFLRDLRDGLPKQLEHMTFLHTMLNQLETGFRDKARAAELLAKIPLAGQQ